MNVWSLFDDKIMSNISEGNPKDMWSGGDDDIYITGDVIHMAGGESSSEPSGSITLNIPDFNIPELNSKTTPKPTRWKYSEEAILKELSDYISGTYNQHYSAGTDKVQTLDLIEACGDGESFCRSNILKYASRYDKKGTARRDILKILHYAVLLLHFNDKNAQRETYPQ